MTPERIARLRTVLDRRQPDLTVVTDFVHKGRNLSAIVRTADAAGVLDMHAVIGDKDYKAFRGTAMGSHSWVKIHRYRELDEILPQLKAQGFQLVATHLSPTAKHYHDIDFTRPTALIMGAEKEGISDASLAMADEQVYIPMMGMVQSFNVSVAAGIILSEAQRQREAKGMYDECRIDRETWQTRFFEWGHPVVRDYCRKNDLEYPPLNEEGEIDNPSAWYASVRKRGDLQE